MLPLFIRNLLAVDRTLEDVTAGSFAILAQLLLRVSSASVSVVITQSENMEN